MEKGLLSGSRILIIGAGLAGCSASRALSRAGYRVTLVEASSSSASRASGNQAGIFKPILTQKPTPSSRFSFLAFKHLLETLSELEEEVYRPLHSSAGLIQLPKSESEAQKLRQALHDRGIPQEEAQWLEPEAASQRAGWPAMFGGVWFSRGGWIDPRDFCRAYLASAGEAQRGGFEFRTDTAISLDPLELKSISREYDAVVFCTAENSRLLPEFRSIRTQVIRGQLSEIEPPAGFSVPGIPLSFKEYVIPLPSGNLLIGATHDREDETMEPRAEDHIRLLDRMGHMLPDVLLNAARDQTPVTLRASLRFSPSTYLPVVGQLKETSKVLEKPAFCLTGLGSRGILVSSLAAEILCSEVGGRKVSLPADLLNLLQPSSK